jgi:signal transduction histidine kinase
MIELSSIQVSCYDDVIETRNKVFRLALDLDVSINASTRLATLVSEVLDTALVEVKTTNVKFVFTKDRGFYYLHIYIACTKAIYMKFKQVSIFKNIKFQSLDDQKPFMELTLRVMDENFIPNEEFLQEERERLIQQSSGEMLQEIRRKNLDLTKAIEDLKNSSQTIQVEKMRALGSMTAGVAHELNNPMMGIMNFVQYAIKHTDEDDRKYRPLVDAEREIKRCQEIITNLLTFSRMKAEGEEGYAQIKPSLLFERTIKLQSYKIRSVDVTIKKHFPKEEPNMEIKVNNVQQVILNLVTNAIDAMKKCDKRELDLTITLDEKNAAFKVQDTGTGMDEETQDKIFEPFFTTKQTGEGTGLGLAVSKSIIEQHHGTLECQSVVGEGTSFIVTLPIERQNEDDGLLKEKD